MLRYWLRFYTIVLISQIHFSGFLTQRQHALKTNNEKQNVTTIVRHKRTTSTDIRHSIAWIEKNPMPVSLTSSTCLGRKDSLDLWVPTCKKVHELTQGFKKECSHFSLAAGIGRPWNTSTFAVSFTTAWNHFTKIVRFNCTCKSY